MINLQRRNYWYRLTHQGKTLWVKVKLKPDTFKAMLKLAFECPQSELLNMKGLMVLLKKHYKAQPFELNAREWKAYSRLHKEEMAVPEFSPRAVPLLDDVSAIKTIDTDTLQAPDNIKPFGPWMKQCQSRIRYHQKMRDAA